MALPLASAQPYTLAAEFSADPHGSLDKPAALGLADVDAFDFVRRPKKIRAALDGAIRYAVIECDNPPGEVFDDVAASLAFLRNAGFVR